MHDFTPNEKNVQNEHFFEKKFADINKMHTFATANEKQWCHSSVGRAKD